MLSHSPLSATTTPCPRGYVTRIDLDEADPQKRVTLISDTDTAGNAYPTIDGITWDPFTRQLLLTAESSAPEGGVFAVGLDAEGDAVDGGKAMRLPALGSGGYERSDAAKGGQAPRPVRFLAEGRDASATFDATSGPAYDDGDNEITGIHVSDGDPTGGGLLGAKLPQPTTNPAWRTFWTQQHGDNTTWEIRWNGSRNHG